MQREAMRVIPSEPECLKKRKSLETAQTNNAVAVTSLWNAIRGSLRYMKYDGDRCATGSHNVSKGFWFTMEQNNSNKVE